MVAFSFKPQFVAAIERGDKRQTIRSHRKRNARFGDTLQLYTGPRMKPRLIGTANCIGAGPVRLDFDKGVYEYTLQAEPEAGQGEISGRLTTQAQRENFALRDGFLSDDHMRAWWIATHGPGVFDGWLTMWGKIERPDANQEGTEK